MLEYRIGWAATSNATFSDDTGWQPWDGKEETVAEVEEALQERSQLGEGLERALDASGFEWWAEARETAQ